MRTSRWIGIVVVTLAAMLLAPAATRAEPPVRQKIFGIVASTFRDVNGQPLSLASDPATPLYSAMFGTPFLTPEGHHITWGEWIQTALTDTSVASAKCVKKGTHVVIELTDLLPDALYTVWLFTLATPTSPTFFGALPSHKGGDNAFRTDATGAATVNAIVPAGPLSVRGEISNCLFENFAFVLQLAYHSDGQLYGGVPGPAGVTLDHINFRFVQ